MKLSTLSSFKLGGDATCVVEVTTPHLLQSEVLQSKALGIPFHIIGKGTNTIFSDQALTKYVIRNEIMGITTVERNDTEVLIRIGAGEHWDDVVKYAVEHNLSGIEAMSAIPGSTGAAPVQNIGAYGQEIKDTLHEVEVYNVEKDTFETLSNTQCEFAYRESVFKKPESKHRYVITYVTLRLSTSPAPVPQYPGVKEYFEKNHLNQEQPSLVDIRNGIIEIRKSKLPDPSIVPNCGSFFKNAIVCKEHFEALQKQYPTIPHFNIEGIHDGKELIKIPTGWLLEQAGFKNKNFGNFKTYDKNALVMTHVGNGTLDELKTVVKEIQNKVREMFGVEIEMEVNVVE